jgi:hypothetical protein
MKNLIAALTFVFAIGITQTAFGQNLPEPTQNKPNTEVPTNPSNGKKEHHCKTEKGEHGQGQANKLEKGEKGKAQKAQGKTAKGQKCEAEIKHEEHRQNEKMGEHGKGKSKKDKNQ